MKREHVSVIANGIIPETATEIVVSFFGPRGGTRSIESLSLENAELLATLLGNAVKKLRESDNAL